MSNDKMIQVTPDIALDESEISLEFIRASGPGGQKVNKTASGVQLRFNVRESPSLPEDVRARLLRRERTRITEDGELILEATRFRSQERNRHDAFTRLVVLIQKAAERPKPRKKTRPTRASQVRRIDNKRRRGAKKQGRKPPPADDG